MEDGAAVSLVRRGERAATAGSARRTGVIQVRDVFARAFRRLGDQAGATAVEYALMLALIAMVVVAAVAYLGHATSDQFASFRFSP
jgi:Flp pilus assembly pilin Flp